MFRRLFGHGPKISVRPRDRGRCALHIDGDYFVQARSCPNDRYVAGARGGRAQTGRGSKGEVVLVDVLANQILWRRPFQRPENPHVSVEGLVAVEDWLHTDKLSGAYGVVGLDGELVWSVKYKANIDTSGMSADGRWVFVSTCNSDTEAHSGKTWLFDAFTGAVVLCRDGWGDVRFDGNQLGAVVKGPDHQEVAFFPFNADGSLPPEHEAMRGKVQDAIYGTDPAYVFRIIRQQLKGAHPDLSRIVPLMDRLDHEQLEERERAQLARLRGELAEAQGDDEVALHCWEQALTLYPKVGIKGRYEKLRKRLTRG